MEKNLAELFKQEIEISAPHDLESRIFSRIDTKAKAVERQEFYASVSFLIFSVVAFIGSAVYAYQSFAASNFGSYFSLLFSDSSTAMSLWKELGLSLIESMPIFGITILIGSIAAVLWSVRKFSKRTPHTLMNSNAVTA